IGGAMGVCGLRIILAYLLWLMPRPRSIGWSSWRIVLPNPRSTLVQIGIGVLDLSAGAVAMYFLLPAYPAVDFITLLAVFVTPVLFGFAHTAPGSLRLIEVAMLVGLPQFSKEELLASLLIFRFLYFILPLSLAAVLLASRELRLIARSAAELDTADGRQMRKCGRPDCSRPL